MVNTCWLFTSTFPFLTDFSTFNSAMVDFNSLLSMISKGLKATWQLFTLTLQNLGTKLLYNLLYFCQSANFVKNAVSRNIQLLFIIQVFLLNLFTDQVFIHFYSNKMIDWFLHHVISAFIQTFPDNEFFCCLMMLIFFKENVIQIISISWFPPFC